MVLNAEKRAQTASWKVLSLLLLVAATISVGSVGLLESTRTKHDASFSSSNVDWMFAIPFSAVTVPGPISGRRRTEPIYESLRKHHRREEPGTASAFIEGGDKMSFLWFLHTPWIDESGAPHWIQEPSYGLGVQHIFLRVPLAYGNRKRKLVLDRIEPAAQPFPSTKVELPGNDEPIPAGKDSLIKMGTAELRAEEIAPFAPGFRETVRLELRNGLAGATYFVEAREAGGKDVYRAALDSSGKGFLSIPRLGERKIELTLIRVDRIEVDARLTNIPGLDLQRFLDKDGKELCRFEEMKSDPYRALAASSVKGGLAVEIGKCWFGNRYEASGNPFPGEANSHYFLTPDPSYKARIWSEVDRVSGVLEITLPAASYEWY